MKNLPSPPRQRPVFARAPLHAALIAALAFLFPPDAFAYDEHSITNPSGTEVMRLRFYGLGDGPYVGQMRDTPYTPTWTLNGQQKRHILAAASYWAEVIRPEPEGLPAIVNVGTYEAMNAFGTAAIVTDDELYYTGMQAALQGQAVPDELLDYGSHGQFAMGRRLPYSADEYLPSQIGLSTEIDIASVAAHELGHSLGVMNLVSDQDGYATPYFADMLDPWGTHLVDDNGNPARPGQAILCATCRNPYDPESFDARLDRAMFIGENVIDALEGGLPGVPVKMMGEYVDGTTALDNNYMSHIELRNSMMSHQNYRNHARYMEAELAIVQDLGYDIDRRNFFGRSVYGSGLDIVNDRGFFARNADGTGYLQGQYNNATVGLGLHVYGSHNTVRQVADLLSAGAGGAGIRVDGENNTLVVDPGVRVHALGFNGQGIMFTYGKGHELVHRGEAVATGELGVGVRFDFGQNLMGNDKEYRGSYIRTGGGANVPLLAELQGALADHAHITGAITGSRAAIYMSSNALVGQISIMDGARIEGDIISEYAQRDASGMLRSTILSFGQEADESGRATGAADADFAMRYAYDIRGGNVHVSLDGGVTALDGQNSVHGVTVQPDAALVGNGQFAVSAEGTFLNTGVLSPGYSHEDAGAGGEIGRIQITGAFEQAQTGRLLADFQPGGAHDVVSVDGTANLGGTLALQMAPGWYANDWVVDAAIVDATQTMGTFDAVDMTVATPTLRFAADPLAGGRFLVSATRPFDAYSQYAANDNARNAGLALHQVSTAVTANAGFADTAEAAEVRSFLTTLDFSARDGSLVSETLTQVTPSVYSAGISASLHHQRDVMNVAMQGLRVPSQASIAAAGTDVGNTSRSGAAAGEWHGFATGFGGKADQDSRNSAVGYDVSTYGMVIGATQRLAAHPAVSVGGHLDIAHQSLKVDAPWSGKGSSTAFGVGVQAGYAPAEDAGIYAYSGLRLGIEDASMDRVINTAAYRASHTADWTGKSASAVVGAGYRWKLSPALTVGPVASLGYAIISRPDIDESGNAATRLRLESETFDALRSSIGLAGQINLSQDAGRVLAAHAQATWDREWLSQDAVQTVAFSALPDVTFTSRNQVVPRDTLGLQAGLSFQPRDRLTIGATVGGRFGGGYDAVAGELRLRWAF